MSFFGPITSPGLSETSPPLVRRTLHRARVLGSFAFVQAAVQVIGFMAGILLVRSLSHQEYAYFTIANTMQGTINLLADIGISVGLASIGGRVWQDRHRFGELIFLVNEGVLIVPSDMGERPLRAMLLPERQPLPARERRVDDVQG
jgi:hypothetical protein